MDISKTRAIHDSCSCEEANRFIDAGWRLSQVIKTVADYSVFRDEEVHYILLWTQETEPAYPALSLAVID